MNKLLIISIIIIAILIGGFFVLNSHVYNEKQVVTVDNFKDVEFTIEGERVRIGDEVSYFGNELFTDLNNNDREDVVFLVTYEPGGSGTFYYVVAALNTENGYVGSDSYLLGDRIAPQTIEVSQNPRHVNVIVANYVDRASGESMTTQPSVGKSVYLKLDSEYMQWGIVEPDFEGESNLPILGDLIAVHGETTCLPKRTTGPITLECATGLKADNNGGFYALKNLFEHDPNYLLSQIGIRLEVIGSVTQEEMHGPDGNQYDIVGVINITSVKKI